MCCRHYDFLKKIDFIDLPEKLRRSPKKERDRKNKRILGRRIEERPSEVNDRSEFGHWEADLVIGSKKAVNTVPQNKRSGFRRRLSICPPVPRPGRQWHRDIPPCDKIRTYAEASVRRIGVLARSDKEAAAGVLERIIEKRKSKVTA